MDARILEDWMSGVLMPKGFEKQRRNWYRNSDQAVVMLNLDKSPDGGRFYINLAASPCELLTSNRPPEHHCHLRTRLESLVPDRFTLERALDLDDSEVEVVDRKQTIVESIATYGIPFLDRVGSIAGMESVIQNHPAANRFAVRIQLRDFLKSR